MQNKPSAIMIFAAGFGTRMGDLTRDIPKPMVPLAGRPMIDHAFDLVNETPLKTRVANLHYKPDTLRAHLLKHDVTPSEEQPNVLETGGGLKHALPLLGAGPVMTLNPDAIWAGPNPLLSLLDAWDGDKMDGLLMCIPPEQALGRVGGGDFVLHPNGKLNRGPGVIYGGAQIIKTDLLARFTEKAFSLNLLWDQMLKNGTLFGLTYPGKWCDVGNPQGLAAAEEMIGNDPHV